MRGLIIAAAALAVAAGAGAGTLPPYLRQLDALRASSEVLPPRLQRVELFAMFNREAPVPPQCYTRTEGRYNPCYVCHQSPVAGHENQMDDGDLQAQYSFSETGTENHWLNLFADRRERIAAISDAEIREWIDDDNYSELAPRLAAAGFQGYIPDLENLQQGAAAFDAQGFARDGSEWVAFSYKPLPSTFWPTNGATDDVMIRLPPQFRRDAAGRPSRDVYRANLALLELAIKDLPMLDVSPLDERGVGRDLDGDGRRGVATQVRAANYYVGGAAAIPVMAFVYPQGTEFLHTVRYVGVDAHGDIVNSMRMKEVRYMRRWLQSDHAQLRQRYEAEKVEKDKGELPAYVNFGHGGLATPMGWQIAGFIEDRAGRLRASTFEENMFCMGCHNSIGSTIDKTFSFARKVDGAAGWGYINLRGMPDAPSRGESAGEIATYLERVGGGSEFRSNVEMQARWFRADGSIDGAALARARDVYDLIAPSAQRALLLNKAYRIIVDEQSYLFGRDPLPSPPQNVYRRIDPEKVPTLPPERQFSWDIRLDWSAALQHPGR
ncbi:MAG TPA: hypothetical protein VJT80_20315 [Steroidobacteraceae bacterium]|nr:hypothetical protein [Steroidobacteraceae bacterium]